jgi:hypothetical protein
MTAAAAHCAGSYSRQAAKAIFFQGGPKGLILGVA